MGRDLPVLIAGAGIAGLSAALALARHGMAVQLYERKERLGSIGAGLQLSPNATRVLDRLGVLERLRPMAVAPRAIVLRDALSLREITSVPLGAFAEARWGAPYLTVHRADLQSALADTVTRQPLIGFTTGMALEDFAFVEGGVAASLALGDERREPRGRLLVAADGVWSRLRQAAFKGRTSRFAGSIAWRATVDAAEIDGKLIPTDAVSAFLHPGVHLIAYPVSAGRAINLVAFTKGIETAQGWDVAMEPDRLHAAFARTAAPLRSLLAGVGRWTTWPIHAADPMSGWIDPRGAVLIGDAAHAMTPFAAQGAAMAIEDAWVLAAELAATPDDIGRALHGYEALRRPRVNRVAARGAFNRFTWHAGGPVALARNLVLKTRSPSRLAADLDWLYGWRID